jgi:hypothetical protein
VILSVPEEVTEMDRPQHPVRIPLVERLSLLLVENLPNSSEVRYHTYCDSCLVV